MKNKVFFSNFRYGFRSSDSTADLLAAVGIPRAFNRSGATRVVALDISKAFGKVWHADVLHEYYKHLYLICSQLYSLISSFVSDNQIRVFLDRKSSQECPINASVLQGATFCLALVLLYINHLSDVICNDVVSVDDTWRQLELVPELESDL